MGRPINKASTCAFTSPPQHRVWSHCRRPSFLCPEVPLLSWPLRLSSSSRLLLPFAWLPLLLPPSALQRAPPRPCPGTAGPPGPRRTGSRQIWQRIVLCWHRHPRHTASPVINVRIDSSVALGQANLPRSFPACRGSCPFPRHWRIPNTAPQSCLGARRCMLRVRSSCLRYPSRACLP